MEMPPTPFPPRPLHPPRLQLRPPPPPPQLLTLPPPLSDPFSPAPVASATLSVADASVLTTYHHPAMLIPIPHTHTHKPTSHQPSTHTVKSHDHSVL
jgi:hypothetical protein